MAIFIFLFPPSLKELKNRLKNRGTDSEEKIIFAFETPIDDRNDNQITPWLFISDDRDERNTLYHHRHSFHRTEQP